MADDLSANQKKIVKLFCMLGSTGSERRMAFTALERTMQSESLGWSDIGNLIESAFKGKFTEAELQEYGQAARAEGVEAGIKIGLARASNGNGTGSLTLPPPVEMADFCAAQRGRLKDDNQRKFIDDMVVATRHRYRLTPGRLGYLASIYIQIGGRT